MNQDDLDDIYEAYVEALFKTYHYSVKGKVLTIMVSADGKFIDLWTPEDCDFYEDIIDLVLNGKE